jgi:malonyl-CoA O-methyltransferase
MGSIDRSRVRRSFDRQAVFYEETVVVQKRVRENILRQLREDEHREAPRCILDVGAGTGELLRAVRNLYPDAFLAGVDLAPAMGRTAMGTLRGRGGALLVEGDAESLPFADCSVDLVLSTSTYQWLNTLQKAFSEALRVLSPGGMFRFALFGGDTLRELRLSYRRALKAPPVQERDRTHHFFSLQDVASALTTVGFSSCRVESCIEREFHPDVSSLLRSLGRIGAGNASLISDRRGLAGRTVMMEMMELYCREYGCSSGIPATYEVIYGKGRKT